MKTQTKTTQLTILGLMTAVLLLMAYTPLGYLNIGPLAITFNVIPVAICAITLGPAGGAAAGAVFGLTSFLQCIGVGGTSAMGAVLFEINPFFAFIQRFVPRFLDGLLLGYIFRAVRKSGNVYAACLVTGFWFRVSEHRVLYDCSGCTFWQHRLCSGTDGRKKCDCLHLHLCWNQCRM